MTTPLAAVAIVPVRLGSQRLPNKALLADTGRPLFIHTWERAKSAGCFDLCAIATDSDAVAAAAQQFDAPVLRTSAACQTGSERCAEAAATLPARIIIDVQGDWPEIEPTDLRNLVQRLLAGTEFCATLAVPLSDPAKAQDRNVVKVVRTLSGHAMYFSREPIPHIERDQGGGVQRLRHIGVYGFTRDTLLRTRELVGSGIERAESLEQLKWLENGMRIAVLDGHGEPWGIETRADYDAFVSRHRNQGGHR